MFNRGTTVDISTKPPLLAMCCYIACQYFFNLSDIILDLKTKQPKGQILDWQSDGVDFNMFNDNQQHINYKSYTMGLRYNQLKSENNGTV